MRSLCLTKSIKTGYDSIVLRLTRTRCRRVNKAELVAAKDFSRNQVAFMGSAPKKTQHFRPVRSKKSEQEHVHQDPEFMFEYSRPRPIHTGVFILKFVIQSLPSQNSNVNVLCVKRKQEIYVYFTYLSCQKFLVLKLAWVKTSWDCTAWLS